MTNTRIFGATLGAAVFVVLLELAVGQGNLTAAATGGLGATTLRPSQGNVSAMSTAGLASNVSTKATTKSPTTASNATAPVTLLPDGVSIPIMVVVVLFLLFCFVGGTVAWWLAKRRYYRQLSQKPDTKYENKDKRFPGTPTASIEEPQEEEIARALNEGTALFTGGGPHS
ncbi:Hypp5171 [Branchiostoma lanceolatum]|uniref:Hypp5171 protein n=1 Tax=Branchiostoma lanceolatum TaxID=7740 RepID=A0A8K0AFR8_BRALA|nr:Hypp5171 [Branchiostoma lanceolatum]